MNKPRLVAAMFLAALFGAGAMSGSASAVSSLPLIFNDGLHRSGTGQTDYATTDLARAASDIAPGATLRFTLSWINTQPYCLTALGAQTTSRSNCSTPGPLNWNASQLQSDLDSISGYLSSGQIKLLPVVFWAPSWATGPSDMADPTAQPGYDPQHPIMPPGDDPTALGWWQQFIASAVSWLEGRYGKSSLAGVEIWNEEESYPFSWSVQPNNWDVMAVRYSHMLCRANAGVRQVDPNLPVILGGIRPSDTTYLTEAYQSPGTDIRGCMNAIGIHPYNDVNGTWVAPSTSGAPFASGASAVAQTAASNNDAGRPIWITEFGYPSASPMTQQQQADWNTQAYNLAPTLPNVQTMAIHTIFDSPGGFEICSGPNTPLPAASQLKQAVSGNPAAIASC